MRFNRRTPPLSNTEYVELAMKTVDGHLTVTNHGYVLEYEKGGRLSGYDTDAIKKIAIDAGLPVIDTRCANQDAILHVVFSGPMAAVGRPTSPHPWGPLSYAPLTAIAEAYRAAGAEVTNLSSSDTSLCTDD